MLLRNRSVCQVQIASKYSATKSIRRSVSSKTTFSFRPSKLSKKSPWHMFFAHFYEVPVSPSVHLLVSSPQALIEETLQTSSNWGIKNIQKSQKLSGQNSSTPRFQWEDQNGLQSLSGSNHSMKSGWLLVSTGNLQNVRQTEQHTSCFPLLAWQRLTQKNQGMKTWRKLRKLRKNGEKTGKKR